MTITVRSRTMDDVHEEFKSVHFPLLTLSIDFDEKKEGRTFSRGNSESVGAGITRENQA